MSAHAECAAHTGENGAQGGDVLPRCRRYASRWASDAVVLDPDGRIQVAIARKSEMEARLQEGGLGTKHEGELETRDQRTLLCDLR